jgi:uncharacterized protein
MPDFRTNIEQYIQEQAAPAHKYGHQPRLYALTREIASLTTPPPEYDDDIVFAAAFLHDLGVFIGHRPEDPEALKKWDHVAYTSEHAPGLLAFLGFPTEKIRAVIHVIAEHQPYDEPTTIEATLLRDADILEQLGAIGILRTAAKLASDTRFLLFTDAQQSLQRALETLPPKIKLDATRQLAIPRMIALQSFLQSLAAEAGENLG